MTGPGYPQHNWPPPPPLTQPPRRRVGAIVAIVVVLLVVIGGGVTYVFVKTHQSASSARDVPAAASTRVGAAPKSAPQQKTTSTRRTTATSRPRASTTARPPTTRQTPKDTPADLLLRNDLYRIPALTDAGCASESQVPLDSVAGVRAFYSSLMPCLASAWAQLRTSKLPFRAPRLVVHSGEPISECGALSYSFYCPSEQAIYMYAPEMITPWQQYPTEASHRITRLAARHTIAHEYGHHLQHLTGIFGALGDDWPGTQLERDLELQATCLGNAFLSSQRSAYPISADDFANQDLWRFITRVPNHGSVGNQERWAERGYQDKKPGACNTFAAPRSEVG